MKRHLLLIRHGRSYPADQGQKDVERTLDNTGIQDVSKLGRFLYLQELIPDQLYTSHAERALESAQLIAEQLKIDSSRVKIIEDLYEASVRTLINQISDLDAALNMVAIIGHNPAITHLCEHYSESVIGNLPPASLVHLSFNNLAWKDLDKATGSVEEIKFPDQITF